MFIASQFSPVMGTAVTTGNPSVWNELDKTSLITINTGGLQALTSSVLQGVRATNFRSSGKLCIDFTINSACEQFGIGICTNAQSLGSNTTNNISAMYQTTFGVGQLRYGSGSTIAVTGAVTTNTVQMAVDIPNHLVYWKLNSTWLNSADPGAGTGGVDYVTTGAVYPWLYFNSTGTTGGILADFTPASPPSGFTSWI
jgi:hypothetical protein